MAQTKMIRAFRGEDGKYIKGIFDLRKVDTIEEATNVKNLYLIRIITKYIAQYKFKSEYIIASKLNLSWTMDDMGIGISQTKPKEENSNDT